MTEAELVLDAMHKQFKFLASLCRDARSFQRAIAYEYAANQCLEATKSNYGWCIELQEQLQKLRKIK